MLWLCLGRLEDAPNTRMNCDHSSKYPEQISEWSVLRGFDSTAILHSNICSQLMFLYENGIYLNCWPQENM